MSSKNNKFYRFCKRIFNLIFKRYYNVQIIGKEHIPKDEPIIIAGNHKNLFDPCLVFISTDREIHFLAKKECSCMINELDKKMSNLGGNLIEEFEQELLFNKDLQSKEIKMPDCYTTQVINKIIDSF